MHYSLQQEQPTQKVSSLEEFITLLKRLSFIRKVDGLPPEECSLCSSNKIDMLKISEPFFI